MKITNRQRSALPSSLTPEQLGQAMSQLDLSAIPPHKRHQAVMDHFMRVMADSIHDQQSAHEIHISRLLHAKGR